MTFDKLLIANRGEIACRIARTCRRLSIRTVAVYSEADANALHLASCDEGVLLGPAPARESYLRGDLIIEAAERTGAQAIHPGYGFLAENAGFAEGCERAGLVFVGPPASVIRTMGDKRAAKQVVEKTGVPVVPGYHGEAQDDDSLTAAAEAIGYPVLIKPSAGGGGKGMRIVDTPEQLKDALASARREARAAFGDDRLLLEKYLCRPRHVEIQIFADGHGRTLHLFERDCSIQRRHQKILEEAPAPGITPERRRAMGATAIAAAEAVGYVGAGTVEFIVDRRDNFYFMEMNTRLQVEHPVTEMITGQDLVEWQLRVAGGEPLPCTQDELSFQGHALEARLYAEDPARGFLPAAGRIAHLRLPQENLHLRIDSGARQGDQIGLYYDPLIAKLIVRDRDRDCALRRLRTALADVQVVGVTTNLDLLRAVAAHPAFAAAELDTGFIQQHRERLFSRPPPNSDRILALATLGELLRLSQGAARRARRSADPCSPWHAVSGWRLNADNRQVLQLRNGDSPVTVTVRHRPGHYRLELPGGTLTARAETDESGDLLAELDGMRLRATVVRHAGEVIVFCQGERHRLTVCDPLDPDQPEEAAEGGLTAPMPGTVIELRVKEGEHVQRGTVLMILEAMKMEHAITAPRAGIVERIHYAPGAQIREGAELLVIVPEDTS